MRYSSFENVKWKTKAKKMIVLITYEDDDGLKVSHGVDSKTFESVTFPPVHPSEVGGFFNPFIGWCIP